MRDEKKKNESGKKILSFDISDEMLENPEIDKFLKDSLIQEADELESELNHSPDLVGVGASDDLFMSIVGKLKEQGVWEEEDENFAGAEAIITEGKSGDCNTAKAEEIYKDEDGIEHKVGTGYKAETGHTAENGTENEAEDKAENKSVNKTGLGEINAVEDVPEDKVDLKAKMELRNDEKSTSHKQSTEEISAELADINKAYHLLSEEDLEDMALGRQMREKKEKKIQKTRHRRKVLKRLGVAVAAFAIVFGVSMTSDANRRLVLNAWDGLLQNMGFRMSTNYLGVMESVRSKTKEEEQALEDISQDLNIAVINFEYLPDGMEYQGYDISIDALQAVLLYSYQGKIFNVAMIRMDREGSAYYVLDNEAVLRETVVNDQNIEAKIWETNLELEEETYVAEIEYNGCRYVLNGMLSLEEIEKIVEFAFIL